MTCNETHAPFFTHGPILHSAPKTESEPAATSTAVDLYDAVVGQMRDTFARKDADYAGDVPLGNIKSSSNFGIEPQDAVFVRLADKFSRLCSLRRSGREPQVRDESFRDTLLDLANYAVIAVLLLDEQKP